MTDLYQEFKSILFQQHEVLEKMLDTAHKQNYALRLNKLDNLNEANAELEELARQAESLEETRRKVQRRLEEAWNLPPAATLKELLAAIPALARAELSELQKNLQQKAGELSRQVRRNQLLTKNALQFNAKLYQALAPGPAPIYLQNGALESRSSFVSFIDKAI